MAISRKKRTNVFNQNIDDQWGEKYLKFILEYIYHWPAIQISDILVKNLHITMNNIENHPEIFDLTDNSLVDNIMRNPNLTHKFIERHPELLWDHMKVLQKVDKPEFYLPSDICIHTLDNITMNPKFTLEFAQKWIPNSCLPKHMRSILEAWYPLSRLTNIKTIEANPDLPWTMNGLSQNKTLSAKYLRDHIDDNWIWNFLSGNSAVTIAMIREHPDKPWHWSAVSMNKNRRTSDIDNNLDLPWDWYQVISNKDILKTQESVARWLDWHKQHRDARGELHLESYLSSANIFPQMSLDRNLRFQTVIDSEHHLWNKHGFLANTFRVEKDAFIAENAREYMVVYRIQQYWNKAITNPYCSIGLNKIERDYKKLFTEDGRIRIC